MNVKAIKPILFAFTALSLVACGSKTSDKSATETTTPPPTSSETDPNYIDVVALAGDATALDTNNSGHGFSTPMPNLSDSELDIHLTGDANFETSFTTAPNDAHPELDGLGPVFNNNNCNACHQRDGRPSTIVPTAEQQTVKLANDAGIFLRVSLADGVCEMPSSVNDFCQVTGVEGFGDQLFHRGILQAREDWQTHNFGGQADVYLSYDYTEFSYPDGSTVTLKKPVFTIDNAWDSPENFSLSALANEDVRFSARNGMPVFGLGLLEAIEEQDILALEDVDDADNDGISGKANWVFDAVKAQAGDENPVSLGRFGWKASTPSVRQQSLGALRGDMGVTNSLFPEESIANTLMHESYLSRTNYQDTGSDEQGLPEASDEFSDTVVFYAETLAVPARRNVADEDVKAGARLFNELNCTGCHTPRFVTANGAALLLGGIAAPAAVKGQEIWPFTDMLLHDMGEELADNRRDFMATGREWKTRPLWGIGLTKTVNPAAGFLHDGRAATLEEAILWHGGEAEKSKREFTELSSEKRAQLISFLQSL
ncbi:di-heme oxidoredictase family protein [Pseudoalteromonas gelatinilytica]|uniref:Thiol oxidoreductase n=1 Tax=Pseudoalteromonas gelatinilytica TaxID=1703256 RepID=A0A3A3ELW4_9GAMM|nr:di-heme oxidoredictase family protein [Pseudoalteromonas profundi]RJF35549.1 thiol oxidoreductase [Pseudoalteromonas profundi]